jgi:hypothetical protein
MLSYGSNLEKKAIDKILNKKHLKEIIGSPVNYNQDALVNLILEIYKKIRQGNLLNISIKNNKVAYYDKVWKKCTLDSILTQEFEMLYNQCKKIQSPLNVLFSLPEKERHELCKKEDPLRVVKHLNCFINNDMGYNWGGDMLLDRKSISSHIIKFVEIQDVDYTFYETHLGKVCATGVLNIPDTHCNSAHPPVVFEF